MFSVLDMFTIGVGPSSSHTVGPMVAAHAFASSLQADHLVDRTARVKITLYGSLALTGLGHGTDRAAMAGLEGNLPATVDTDHMMHIREICALDDTLNLAGLKRIHFDYDRDVVFEQWKRMAAHPNGMRSDIDAIWRVMRACVDHGCTSAEPTLPGGLDVPRRAPKMYRRLASNSDVLRRDSRRKDAVLESSDAAWVDLFALAVSEENSGAEVGCQGEVGSACSMAAAGLAAVVGGTPEQVENAAEIGIEHNLGLTCDPVGGLVQIPCIERNAMAANTAINAVRMAMLGDGSHIVTLDQAIETMKQTGEDMMAKYKETSKGGLAVNVVEC